MSARGRCFELAGKKAGDIGNCNLVHGTAVTARGRIPHAWVEKNDKVIDLTISKRPIDKMEYYEKTKAHPDVVYSGDEGLFNALRSGHWGPWRVGERVKLLKAKKIKRKKR